MVRFYGNAAAKVDDKGRIVFPAIYRDAMARSGESDLTLIVKKSVQGNCLNLYTLEEWARRSDKVLENIDPELNPLHASFWSKFNEDVFYVVPDGKLGRLNIPSELLKAAGINKEVVFAGTGYKIEVWAKESREASLMSDEEFHRTAAAISSK